KKRMASPPQSRSSKRTSLCADATSLRIVPKLASGEVYKHVFQGVRSRSGFDELVGFSFHHNLAMVDNGYSGAEMLRFIKVMGAVDNGCSLFIEFVKQRHDDLLGLHIYTHRRFIKEQYIRPVQR